MKILNDSSKKMEVQLRIWLISIISLVHIYTFSQSDSVSKQKQWLKASIGPTTLMLGSIYTLNKNVPLNKYEIQQKIQNSNSKTRTSLDSYLWATPAAAKPYILDWIKPGYAKNDFWNRSILLAKSQVVMMAIVFPTKHFTQMERPYGTELDSYPSGHTAQAFVTATFMHEELKHKSIWYSIGAYSIASTVGAYRVLNNHHWISDVLAGAAIGILSTKIAYLTHRYRWGKKRNEISFQFTPIFYSSMPTF